jgi:hypothetical protein
MNTVQPPAIAIRLMEEAGTEPAVIGDLIETYSQRPNARWFWRQAIAASAPSPVNALRWAIAIPTAYWLSVRLAGLIRGLVGFEPVGSASAAFVSAAALVSIASLIVPSRRVLVARTLFGIVISAMTILILLPPGFDRSFRWTPRIAGCAGLVGGLISYVFMSSRFKAEVPRPTARS